ncbi:60S ribosomal protein L43 [Coemansia spiralis]|uniref:60S ribosomal protein L43 n=1 Tax=Coemansia spiralis TaxID=417178 RepID=A0A9W8GQV9_9FUNG|nr:60S ribosomal protein L43 [Coemansia spiralis]
MQRGPYSRETTDISDQELRQILESENISGLPAPYCLAPHYDGQGALPQNALWTAPAASPSLAQRAAENALATSHQQHYHQLAGHDSNSSQSSPGGHDGGNLGGGADGALPATGAAAESSTAPRTPLPVATGETSRRRTRTTLTPYQLRVLFRVWERTQYPSSDLRFRLASNLMMTPRNVQIWFQNQRQKTKERAEMRRRTHSPSTHSTVLASMGATQIPHHHMAHGPGHLMPVHLLEFHAHDGHFSAISMPGRSPPESPFRYTHGPPPAPPAIPPPTSGYAVSSSNAPRQTLYYQESAVASGAPSLQTTSPVSGAYAMLTPPALYPHSFSQQPPQRPHPIQPRAAPPHSASYPHPHHLPHHLSLHPQHHLHHQRHLSQPHALHYTPARTPSSLAPASSQKSTGQQPYYSPSLQSGDALASEKGSDAAQCLIPSPTTPTFVPDQQALQQSLSPLSPRRRFPSPPLSSSMHSLSMTPGSGPSSLASQTLRKHPASRRARLVDILNPITSATASGEASAVKGAPDNKDQLGPLPSLGAVLANVQSDEDNSTGAAMADAPLDATSSTPANSAAAKRTKKVGITGKYGTRYGASLRKLVKKMEITQHASYICTFCGKESVKRTSVGIWNCRGCRKTIAGGAYVVSTPAASIARSNIRRIRELSSK